MGAGKIYQAITSNRELSQGLRVRYSREAFFRDAGWSSMGLAVVKLIMQAPAVMEGPRLIFQSLISLDISQLEPCS